MSAPTALSGEEISLGAEAAAVADAAAGRANALLESVLFYDVAFWSDDVRIPFVVAWLICGAAFFTVYLRFANVRAFGHAIQVVRGKFSSPSDAGDVSHFQALTTALSATVGLGNIAGVAVAVSIGGPGATVWMILAGFLGMSLKLTECTLAQRYREKRSDGSWMGGAMIYLSRGLGQRGWPRLGKALAVLFSLLCVGGSMGGGNSFQVSQSLNAVAETFPALRAEPWLYGALMTFLAALVIVGGIRRIAHVTDKLVPLMALVYLGVAGFVLCAAHERIPDAIVTIWRGAVSPEAAYGGVLGVLVVGFQRAAFSNEAGAGSAAIAHSAAKTPYPVREGIVALLEPFIDTVVICTITALVIVVTGVYAAPEHAALRATHQGAALTSRAVGQVSPLFSHLLSLCVFLFAYSTMISWSYYGERCWTWLFGERHATLYRVAFLACTFLGSIVTATNVMAFGDLMILGMSLPNLLGVFLLSGEVRRELDGYWSRLRRGELHPVPVPVPATATTTSEETA